MDGAELAVVVAAGVDLHRGQEAGTRDSESHRKDGVAGGEHVDGEGRAGLGHRDGKAAEGGRGDGYAHGLFGDLGDDV
ncbi:MAG: hypothetical protein EBW87_04020 [Burkholderiaceae bacterium]|nr:hypothetical protein [Burkholderiaceae bacterium]